MAGAVRVFTASNRQPTECTKISWNVAVAVTDTHGFLVYFERMENTQTASMDIAVG